MKRLPLILALAAVACTSSRRQEPDSGPRPASARPAASAVPGAPSPREAVDEFLAAVRTQDIQTMVIKWGFEKGPARDGDKKDQLEKSALIMQCYLSHQSFRVLNDAPGEGGRRVFRVELTNGPATRATNFVTVQGPRSRWYVESADLNPVKDLCRTPPAP